MSVSYLGYWSAFSGMGEASRVFIRALHEAGVDVTTKLAENMLATKSLGDDYDLCENLHEASVDYKIKIMHLTPDLVTKHLEPMKYHIFHLFWETDSLPDWWVWALNLVDEVWTGTEWNKKIFIESGVKKPIYVFPQPCNSIKKSIEPRELDGIKEPFKGFMFYSMFQWNERKDPKSLLQAYWREFQGEKNVGLLIKTYREKFSNQESMEIIKDILSWKKELNQEHYPRVFLYTGELSRDDVERFHATGDCFVSPHRGEGWGRIIAEAMAMGKPVITTNLGGITEYLKGSVGLVDYQMTGVFNMDFVPWYSKEQRWGQVDVSDFRKKMRYIFDNQDKVKELGEKGKKLVEDKFSYKTVGKQMKKRIDEIEKGLK